MTKPDFDNLTKLAEQREEDNCHFRAFLKWHCRQSGRAIDRLVSEVTDRVWADIDCTACGRCCRELRPAFSPKEQKRLALRLAVSVDDFRQQYLECKDEEDRHLWRVREAPCPFLQGSRCSVYEDRPAQCRDYPYLYKRDFRSRTIAMVGQTHICLIVYQALEDLKRALGYRSRRTR
jgi:uncharacterized protein